MTAIIAAAVRFPYGGKTVIWPLHRHADFFDIAKQMGFQYNKNEVEQGFIAWDGEKEFFVSRVEARKIAIAAKQIEETATPFKELFSEDLW